MTQTLGIFKHPAGKTYGDRLIGLDCVKGKDNEIVLTLTYQPGVWESFDADGKPYFFRPEQDDRSGKSFFHPTNNPNPDNTRRCRCGRPNTSDHYLKPSGHRGFSQGCDSTVWGALTRDAQRGNMFARYILSYWKGESEAAKAIAGQRSTKSKVTSTDIDVTAFG